MHRGLYVKDQLPALKKFQKAVAMKKADHKIAIEESIIVEAHLHPEVSPVSSLSSRLAALKGK
jgi:hypothetical protein